jgi:hypothetical protein
MITAIDANDPRRWRQVRARAFLLLGVGNCVACAEHSGNGNRCRRKRKVARMCRPNQDGTGETWKAAAHEIRRDHPTA